MVFVANDGAASARTAKLLFDDVRVLVREAFAAFTKDDRAILRPDILNIERQLDFGKLVLQLHRHSRLACEVAAGMLDAQLHDDHGAATMRVLHRVRGDSATRPHDVRGLF